MGKDKWEEEKLENMGVDGAGEANEGRRDRVGGMKGKWVN